MDLMTKLRCKECGTEYPPDKEYLCLNCLGPLEVEYDYARIAREVNPGMIAAREHNLWRYRELLPLEGEPVAGFNSGWTPLIRADRLASRLGVRRLYIKDDSINHPSLSYKDRVVSVAVSRGKELGFKIFACASTGNLGNSLAAHCAAVGVPALIFVPASIEPPKFTGSLVFGPGLVALNGNYDDVNRLCAEIGDHYGWGFVNVNLRPYYTEGAKTVGYEIAEQLGWHVPDHVVLPTAGGTLLPRVARAFRELREMGWTNACPRIHSAQAQGCSPVIKALHAGAQDITPEKPSTVAHSIAIGNPADGRYVLQEVRNSGGWGDSASDGEILEAIGLLAETQGIFTEPAGGTTIAVTRRLIQQGRIDSDSSVVAVVTGNGYKAVETVGRELEVSAVLDPNLDIFMEWYEQQDELVVGSVS